MPFIRLSEWRSVALPLSIGFLLLIGVVAATTWFGAQLASSNGAVKFSMDVELRLSQTFSLLQDAETGQRGFLLTGDESYLAPYETAIGELKGEIEEISALTSSDALQRERIGRFRRAVDGKLEELKQTIALRRSGAITEALARVREGTGKRLMTRARTLLNEILFEEARLLAIRQAKVDAASHRVQLGVVVAFLLLMAVATFTLIKTRQQTLHLIAAGDQLRTANEKLVQEALQRERLEDQIRQTQKMEAIGQLTGGLAHDFNNMLAVIISSLNLLKRRMERGESNLAQFIDGAMQGADRASTLTKRLLAFARQQPLSPEPIDANKFVAGISDLLRRTLGETIRLETVLAGGLWRMHADASQLETAILNLAVNARDAMPDGGRLTIETANAHLDDAYAAQHVDVPSGQYVLVAVSDSGLGMGSETIAKAFDPFFTTKAVGKGTGLGLSQVHGFVRQSNGHVKIYSEIGNGTTVKLYLPRFSGPEADIGRSIEKAPKTGRPEEIVLVVEDEDQVRQLSVEALRELGYTVLEAPGAVAALRTLDQRPDVSLLFTDIVMPEISGRKLADEALRRRPSLKVLYTTGYTGNAIIHNGVLDPGVHLITKPFTLDQLASKVREVLGD